MIKILYWLEPWIELNNPTFRYGTFKNHLINEFSSLHCSGKYEIALLTSPHIIYKVKKNFNVKHIKFFTIDIKQLKKIFSCYQNAANKWFNNSYSSNELKYMTQVVAGSINNYKPDIIMVYESSAPFLKYMFPNALLLNTMLGIFSREPYPEMGIIDPVGIYKNSYLNKFLHKIIDEISITHEDIKNIQQIQKKYKDIIEETTPFNTDIREGFKKVFLLPLQVSNYFAFSENIPKRKKIKTQYDLIIDVLKNVSDKVGILVTHHPAETKVINKKNYLKIKKRYPNLLYFKDIENLKWGSQYLMPFIDGVITVSSSLGLQAYFWEKKLISYGDALTYLSDNKSVCDSETLKNCIDNPQIKVDRFKILKFLFFFYNIDYHNL